MKSTIKIAAARAAVVFIEPQNDFLSPRGTVYAFIKNEVARRNVVVNLVALLAGAREKGVRVIYAPFRPFEREFPEVKPGGTANAELAGAVMTPRIEHIREHHRIGYRDEGEVCLECGHAWPCDTAVAMEEIRELRHRSALLGIDGLDGPEFLPQLRPRTGDIIVEGNKTLDAFHFPRIGQVMTAAEFLVAVESASVIPVAFLG